MSNGCTKCLGEFKGWLKAFTPIELLITILEGILLVLLLIFIVFFILHFLSCGKDQHDDTTTEGITTHGHYDTTEVYNHTTKGYHTTSKKRPTCTYTANQTESTRKLETSTEGALTDSEEHNTLASFTTPTSAYDDFIVYDPPDGRRADDDEMDMVVALVKIKPAGLTFGCILTALSEHWTITAASCIDSIEEVDSLDNFVILINYGGASKGRPYIMTDVRVHPQYTSGNGSFDLALVRAGGELGRRPPALPSLLDYFACTLGEKVNILGYGEFRTIDHGTNGQRLHSAAIHILPSSLCSPPTLEERHLTPLARVAHGRCGLAPLCAGVLYERGHPCNFCAGAPLLKGRVLLGVMADNGQCGSACEPALYANVAAVRDWIVHVIEA